MRHSCLSVPSARNFSTLGIIVLILSAVSFAAVPDRIASSIVSGETVALAKSLHPKARPQNDLGLVEPSRQLSYITLLLAPSASQQKALDLLLAQQQDPTSTNYHKWLTPQEYAERFGLSQNDLTKISAWLTSQGFQILSIGGGHNSVIFSGTAAQAQRAFGTEIHGYRVNGEEHFANSTSVVLPSALGGIVRNVIGLHDFRPRPANSGQKFGRMRSVPNYYDGGFIFPNFLAPDDVATIYDITPLYSASTPIDGTGQKLAIVGQTDIYLSDINNFRTGFGLAAIPSTGTGSCTTNGSGLVISPCSTTNFDYVLLGTDPGSPSSGDLGESDLDIEWSGAVARNAQIIFVNGETAGGVNDALVAAINPPTGPPLAQVISMSYGNCEANAGDMETVLQEGNAEGVTILNSSGDEGAAACDFQPQSGTRPFPAAVGGRGVSYPASSPEVTGVGGTGISLANDSYPNPSSFWNTTLGTNGGTAVSYIPELGWNDDEELAQYCHSPAPHDNFCSTGGGTAGWQALPITATAAQVQGDIWISIGGGGASNCFMETNQGICQSGFPQPTWQQLLSVAGAPAGVRYVPDVSMFASPDFPGYIFCTQLSELNDPGTGSSCASGIANAINLNDSLIGGTSASSPVFAGIVTLLNQYVVQQGVQSSPGLGNINPTLYFLAKHNQSAFHQVKTGDNMVYCQVGTPSGQPAAVICPAGGVFGFQASNADSATGYNLVTGLGSVDANELALAFAGSTAPDFTLAVTATPSTATINQSVVWNGTLTATNGYTNTVSLSCGTGAPSTCTINPSSSVPLSAGTPFTVTVASTTAGTFTFNISATDGTITHSQSVTLTVSQNFTVPGTLTAPTAANAGQSTSTTMNISTVGGGAFGVNVTYTCSAGLPTGATCSFSPTQVNAGATSPASVTITVQTAGPFTGTASGARRRIVGRNQPQRLWLPLTLPLAGMLLVGLAGRGSRRRYGFVGLCLALAVTGLLVACGGGGNSTPPATVSVSPSSVTTLYPSLAGAPAQMQQFTATVNNSTSQTVTWAVTGGAANGTIDQTGLYTAPATLPSPANVSVTATSSATITPGTATVDLKTPTPSGTYPITVTVVEGSLSHTTTFNLTVN